MVDTRSGGSCRLSVAVLEVDGADHAEFRVPPSAVVDPFDPVADREPNGNRSASLRPVVVRSVQADYRAAGR